MRRPPTRDRQDKSARRAPIASSSSKSMTPVHARKPSPDARRDCTLQRAVVRVNAELVLSDLAAAVALIRAAL